MSWYKCPSCDGVFENGVMDGPALGCCPRCYSEGHLEEMEEVELGGDDDEYIDSADDGEAF